MSYLELVIFDCDACSWTVRSSQNSVLAGTLTAEGLPTTPRRHAANTRLLLSEVVQQAQQSLDGHWPAALWISSGIIAFAFRSYPE
jgi:hypothetical protein